MSLDRDPSLRTMIASDWDLDFTAVPLSGADIFQGLLQKPVNGSDPERKVREITIEGSFTCSKMRPDGFGGWVERITASGIRYDSTKEMLERWSNENEQGPEDALLEAAKAVLANWEHGDLAAAARQLAAALQAEEAEVDHRRRAARSVASIPSGRPYPGGGGRPPPTGGNMDGRWSRRRGQHRAPRWTCRPTWIATARPTWSLDRTAPPPRTGQPGRPMVASSRAAFAVHLAIEVAWLYRHPEPQPLPRHHSVWAS